MNETSTVNELIFADIDFRIFVSCLHEYFRGDLFSLT